jgi:CHAT domain-containing protein
VADQSTAELMAEFFREIAKDPTRQDPVLYAKALHSAKQRLRKTEFASPYYWAPFVLIGPGGEKRMN